MENKIINLKMPDLIRLRPEIVFTSDDVRGSVHAVRMLLNIFISEAVMGYCKQIDVRIARDDSIEIFSEDRGFALDETIIDGKPSWYYDFCELYAGPREVSDGYIFCVRSKHNSFYGDPDSSISKYPVDSDLSFDLCCVQCASEFLNVEAVRNNIKKKLCFKRGYSIADLEKCSVTEGSSTKIQFKLDDNVFKDVKIPYSAIADALREAAVTIPGLICSIEDERYGQKDRFCFKEGVADYVREIIGDNIATPVYVKEIEAKGRDRYNKGEYEARAKVALAFSESKGHVECFHNYRVLEGGGHHMIAVKEKILRTLERRFYDDSELSDLSFEKIAEKIVLLIETNCTWLASDWINGTRSSISNNMIKDMCSDLFVGDFEYYVKENGGLIRSFLQQDN